jgi:hypothetical protein
VPVATTGEVLDLLTGVAHSLAASFDRDLERVLRILGA